MVYICIVQLYNVGLCVNSSGLKLAFLHLMLTLDLEITLVINIMICC